MNKKKENAPEDIHNLSMRCVAHVKKRFGIELDFTSNTLSVLDHYSNALAAEENHGEAPPPGDPIRYNLVHLFAPTLGAYFGETLANVFGGRWRFADKEPQEWRFEFDSFFLTFNPAGAAADVFARHNMENWGSAFVSAPTLGPRLQERFDAVPQVSDDEFFSFGTYFESIQIAEDFLKEVSLKDGPVDCSSQAYDFIFSKG